MRVQELKRRLDESAYAVDSAAVAGAILRRPAARRLLLVDLERTRGAARQDRQHRRRPSV